VARKAARSSARWKATALRLHVRPAFTLGILASIMFGFRQSFIIGSVALTGALVFGCSDPTRPEPPLTHPRGILLFSVGDGEAEIMTMTPDGRASRRVTNNDVFDQAPSWSPDGRRIVFESYRDFVPGYGLHWEIYVMNADGTNERQLTDGDYDSRIPRWSPDGTRILFHRWDTVGGGYDIYVMNSDGSDVRALTSTDTEELGADWSPDGTKILFVSWRPPRGIPTIYVMDSDGSNVRQLSDDRACPSSVYWPRWSPDGTRIAYVCWTSYGTAVWVMNADGSNPIRLNAPTDPNTVTSDMHPIWSPDSEQVAFTSGENMSVASASGGPAEQVADFALLGSVLPGDWRGQR
jgi:Tol biopolymer transport system component